MKECSICNQEKPISEFYVSGKYLYPQCKVCKRAKDKNTYHTSDKEKARRIASDAELRCIRRLKAQIFVYDILSKSNCIDCGEARLETLDFDHVRDHKTLAISVMINKGLHIDTIQNELSKCEVRCSNCHRMKTSKQLLWARSDWNKKEACEKLQTLYDKILFKRPARKKERNP